MELRFAPAQECDIERIYASNKELIDTYEVVENIDYEKVLQWVLKKIKTNIFISWSGNNSRLIANKLKELIEESTTREQNQPTHIVRT